MIVVNFWYFVVIMKNILPHLMNLVSIVNYISQEYKFFRCLKCFVVKKELDRKELIKKRWDILRYHVYDKFINI